MAVDFTPEQKRAIETSGRNILVSAAAGSGKTAVLVERIVHMICREEQPVDIDRLLIVTFTNAAAAEMRERIGIALNRRLEVDPGNEHLQKQATLLHNAQITTIDSFCLFVLRNNFNDIGLDPAFRIADEGEIKLLKQEVLASLLEDRFASADEDFYHCVEVYCPGGNEKPLENHILSLYDFAMSHPWPEEWLLERKRDYSPLDREAYAKGTWEQVGWMAYLMEYLQRMISGCLEQLYRIMLLFDEPDGPIMYKEQIMADVEQLQRMREISTLEEIEKALHRMEFGRLSSKKMVGVSTEKRELAKNMRNSVKDCLKDLEARFFATPLSLALEQQEECERAVSMLIDLCLEFKERLDGAKRDINLLDFSDMEHFALNILLEKTEEGPVPTKTALDYREHFTEVLIDEYQDSNLVQECLLKAVSGEEDGHFNRFLVGDVKQSIYKFRLARPDLFLEKYNTYSMDGEECQRIDLHKNFRSRSEVVDTVNRIFTKIMDIKLGGIAYDESASLRACAAFPSNKECKSELILMEKPERDTGISAKALEAMGIARRIKELRGSFLVTDKETKELRPVRYQDMVVLLRTNSGWDEEFKQVFEAEDIPAYVPSKTGYFAATEIQNVMQFLRVLDNPLQDIPLFGVLKSVFGGFSDEEIARIKSLRAGERSVGLYECLKQCAQEYSDANGEQDPQERLGAKCQVFLNRLSMYRSYTTYMPIRTLLQNLFRDYGYLDYVSALPAGEQRRANVDMLLEKASAFEKTSYYGLYHFIRYMEQLEKYQVDYGEASLLNETADVVRIMSIHKSKGLEFPVVFVAGLSKRFNMQDTSQAVIVDVDMGIGTDYVDPEKRLKNKTLRKSVVSEKMKNDNLAEEIRIFYVALTRAKEKLILTATMQSAEQKAGESEFLRELEQTDQPLSYQMLLSATSYLSLVLPVMAPSCIWNLEDLMAEGIREAVGEVGRRALLAEGHEYVDEELRERIRERFAYRYPHANLAGLYTKTTVSELKIAAMEEVEDYAFHAFEIQEVEPYLPVFMRGKTEVSGATRGSAVHKAMELLDFSIQHDFMKETKQKQVEIIKTQIDQMQKSGRLDPIYAEAVAPQKISTFFGSALAARMAAAGECGLLRREQPFVYGISADRITSPKGIEETGQNIGFPPEETVLIQGIIDVFFEEDDALVLADYKTDVVKTPEELIQRYKVQLDYYEEALSKITGKKVKERILYSFYLGCEIQA